MNQANSTQSAPAIIDVGDILRGIWRRRRSVAMFTIVAVALAAAFVFAATPRYTAESQVLVQNLETAFSSSASRQGGANRLDQSDVLSQVEVIKSRDLAKRVIKALELTKLDEFNGRSGGNVLTNVINTLKALLPIGARNRAKSAEQKAVEVFAKRLTAYPVPQSRVIVIRYSSQSPKVAAQVANTLAETYVTWTREAQSEPTGRARDWLAKEIERLRKKVIASEVAAEKFRAKAGLTRGSNQTTLNTQELSELNSQIILAEAARSEAQARAQAIRDLLRTRGNIDAAPEVQSSALIQRLREQQVTLRRQLAQLSTTYLSSHPRIKAVRQELADLDRQIRQEAFKIVGSLEQQARVAAAREASLRASLNKLKQKAGAEGPDNVRLRSLEREAATNRSLLETYLSRYSDASARQGLVAQPGFARIIATADVPSEKSYPKTLPILLLSALAGLGLGLGLAFIGEVMSLSSPAPAASEPRAQRGDEVLPPAFQPQPAARNSHNRPGARTVAAGAGAAPPDKGMGSEAKKAAKHSDQRRRKASKALPTAKSATNPKSASRRDVLARVAVSAHGDASSVDVETLAPVVRWTENLVDSLRVKSFAIADLAGGGDHAASVALTLARVLAARDRRVVLIDADLENAAIGHVAAKNCGAGLADILTGKATFSEVMERDRASPTHILGAGINLEDARPLLGGERMRAVVDALGQVYDIVLLHERASCFPANKKASVVGVARAGVILAQDEHLAAMQAWCGAALKAGLIAAQAVVVEDHSPAPAQGQARSVLAKAG